MVLSKRQEGSNRTKAKSAHTQEQARIYGMAPLFTCTYVCSHVCMKHWPTLLCSNTQPLNTYHLMDWYGMPRTVLFSKVIYKYTHVYLFSAMPPLHYSLCGPL